MDIVVKREKILEFSICTIQKTKKKEISVIFSFPFAYPAISPMIT